MYDYVTGVVFMTLTFVTTLLFLVIQDSIVDCMDVVYDVINDSTFQAFNAIAMVYLANHDRILAIVIACMHLGCRFGLAWWLSKYADHKSYINGRPWRPTFRDAFFNRL